MNHVEEIRHLSNAVYGIIQQYAVEIEHIKDPKHHVEKIQELDKVANYAGKMMKHLDDMNQWFIAFGVEGNATEN